jgi:hypothetical protein
MFWYAALLFITCSVIFQSEPLAALVAIKRCSSTADLKHHQEILYYINVYKHHLRFPCREVDLNIKLRNFKWGKFNMRLITWDHWNHSIREKLLIEEQWIGVSPYITHNWIPYAVKELQKKANH